MSCMAGSIGAFYSARGMDKALMLAGGTTVMVVATVTGLTFWSKFDITKVLYTCLSPIPTLYLQFWQLFLILPIVTLFAFIFVMISGYNDVAIICYSALGVIAFTFYLAFVKFWNFNTVSSYGSQFIIWHLIAIVSKLTKRYKNDYWRRSIFVWARWLDRSSRTGTVHSTISYLKLILIV